ncbi:Tumor necrosis factor ligand superfamily member 10 [Calypte anna]|uniref:Tumor necrosis factor ligand superfamily member 10 n=1 Tax=Calypte anna TaxID=9244 RepID=A0A091HJ76_CALAN|nr:Tumor necrosis factor ligand superfamily member 10 [Calypte anna]
MLTAGGPSPGQTCGAVLVTAVLLQSVCVAVTYLYFTNELKQLRDTYSRSGIACLTGEEIGNFVQNLDLIESQDRAADPCWQVKWHLGKLIKKMMSRSFEENISAVNVERALTLPHTDGQQPRSPPYRIAAHLTGNSNRKSSLAPRSYVNERLGRVSAALEGTRQNGYFKLCNFMHFYIYSQTYFRFRENENEGSDLLAQIRNPKQLVQYVYKLTNYPEPILLMKSARTSCWSKKAEYGLYSVYQGGVFQLKREDRIFVSVSNSEIVDMDKEASFFGAFMVA